MQRNRRRAANMKHCKGMDILSLLSTFFNMTT